ncbi:MAG: hypothetical protein NTV21_19685, partial [Planctomycetota bacterium]|nr:hypothetical protein [Planctomycetota bacterium]
MSRGLAGLPRSFWFLVLGMWINRLGAFVLPFLSLYLQEREGLSEDGASIVLGAWGAGSVLAALNLSVATTVIATVLIGSVLAPLSTYYSLRLDTLAPLLTNAGPRIEALRAACG